jgi:general secretion pathway protein G
MFSASENREQIRQGNQHYAPSLRRVATTSRGFTLIELMIVIAIILILASIAVGRYQVSYEKAKEATLKQDLFVLRKAIQDYTADKEAAPNSLDDLVSAHYIGKVPTDPETGGTDWVVDSTNCADAVLSPDQIAGGICDVHSASDAISPFEGSAYSSW